MHWLYEENTSFIIYRCVYCYNVCFLTKECLGYLPAIGQLDVRRFGVDLGWIGSIFTPTQHGRFDRNPTQPNSYKGKPNPAIVCHPLTN